MERSFSMHFLRGPGVPSGQPVVLAGFLADQEEDDNVLEEDNVSDFSAQEVIGSNDHDSIKRKKAPEQSKSATQASNTNGKRRRRSMESKQASEQQTYDVAVIKECRQPYYQINEGDEITIDDVEVEKEPDNDNTLAIKKGNNNE